MKIKQAYKKVIAPFPIVNGDTGELVNGTSINIPMDDKVIINYNDYTTIDREAIMYLETILPAKEMFNLQKMINMIEDSTNILYQKGSKEHHTDETLAKEFKHARSAFFRFLKIHISAGVIYQLKGKFNDKVYNKYILNPFIARHSKVTDKKSVSYFSPISKNNTHI